MLCGTQGEILYTELVDRLFGAPGEWTLRQCSNETCGFVWLDPIPLEEDIGLAYRSYYTHKQEGILGSKYQLINRMLWGVLSKITGVNKEQRAIYKRYLSDVAPGVLLDVGCGSGEYMKIMKQSGWMVEGVEVDPIACRFAREVNKLLVHQGVLEEVAFQEASFDAIVMNHVLEHVHDPIRLLKECYRLVKPGGRVIVITPNITSWGHSKFKHHWRGLEPPRHIHIFSPATIKSSATLAGFQSMEVRTTSANAGVIFEASMKLRTLESKEGSSKIHRFFTGWLSKVSQDFLVLVYQYREFNLWKVDSGIGEEVVMICTKDMK